jgi:integrase
MSVLFNHARRYDLYDRNPIQWVRQSAKRRTTPDVLTSKEVRQLLAALEPRERRSRPKTVNPLPIIQRDQSRNFVEHW